MTIEKKKILLNDFFFSDDKTLRNICLIILIIYSACVNIKNVPLMFNHWVVRFISLVIFIFIFNYDQLTGFIFGIVLFLSFKMASQKIGTTLSNNIFAPLTNSSIVNQCQNNNTNRNLNDIPKSNQLDEEENYMVNGNPTNFSTPNFNY